MTYQIPPLDAYLFPENEGCLIPAKPPLAERVDLAAKRAAARGCRQVIRDGCPGGGFFIFDIDSPGARR